MTAPKTLIRTGEDLDVEVSRGKRFAFWDELRGVVTSRFPGGPSANSLAPYGWLALLILTNAVVSTLSGAHDSAARGGPTICCGPAILKAPASSARCPCCRCSGAAFI